MKSIACSLIRGGTSRGAFFHAEDLPEDEAERNALLVRIMGGPDALQIDGIGGGHPLTSKVAILKRSSESGIDVSYLFLQVDPLKQTVSDAQNCGNILSGVGIYAMHKGWVTADDPLTTVRVRMENTGSVCHLDMQTPQGRLQTLGDTAIDGVPGTGSPIVCNYLDIAGASCGALLPTGSVTDVVEGVRVTCIDNGMPVVVMLAQELGIVGDENPDELDRNTQLKSQIEAIRLTAARAMNLGDVLEKSVPKMCLVSTAKAGGAITTRTFIPHVCHQSIGVLGAVSVATACMLKDSVPAEVAVPNRGNPAIMDIEHPNGSLRVQLALDDAGGVTKAGVIRTARLLFSGEVYV